MAYDKPYEGIRVIDMTHAVAGQVDRKHALGRTNVIETLIEKAHDVPSL